MQARLFKAAQAVSPGCPKGDAVLAPKGEEEEAPNPPKAGVLAAAPKAGVLLAPKAPNAGAASGRMGSSRGREGCQMRAKQHDMRALRQFNFLLLVQGRSMEAGRTATAALPLT
jgi:hypothetical protein